MKEIIDIQLEIVGKAISWVKDTPSMNGAKGDLAIGKLIDFRRRLKKKKYAIDGLPAAAIYGESQVGKSYLVSSLLSADGKPFEVGDERTELYNFIRDINPKGDGSESTSLVTRFSVTYQPINNKFPVKAVLLSISDIIMAICDSFYLDIRPNHDSILKSEDIDEEVNRLFNKFNVRSELHNLLEEDDLFDIKEYFETHLSKAGEVINSRFFGNISKIISKVSPAELGDVFSLLWNKNFHFTSFFNDLVSEYNKLKFAAEVFLPIEAVLNDYGTLLDVERLKEIYSGFSDANSNFKTETAVYISIHGQNHETTIRKPFLCALIAEMVFSLPNSLASKKQFLNQTDLLDFPGARSRMNTPENLLGKELIHTAYLRGKVSFLFNKYSKAEKINLLLLCVKHTDPAQRALPELLNNWVSTTVGQSIDMRQDFIEKSIVPPLFIVCTWFNVNLQYDPSFDKAASDNSLIYRWNQRFIKTLSDQIIESERYGWFTNWTKGTPFFQNIYLLRDFGKSESFSNIFRGYNELGYENEEVVHSTFPDFKNKLKGSFIDFEFVRNHFADPERSWDLAASKNEDGSKLIIQNLIIAADNINKARNDKNRVDLRNLNGDIGLLLNDYYNSEDKSLSLRKAISDAGKLQAKLAIRVGADPYFFGLMMKEFMVSSNDVYNLFIEKINDIERRDIVNMDRYVFLRLNVTGLDPDMNFDFNLECLRKKFELDSLEDCRAFFENQEQIDLNELFYGNRDRVKNFAQVLAISLENYWLNEHMVKNRIELTHIYSNEDIKAIQDVFRMLFQKLQVSEKIALKIRQHIDGHRSYEDAYEMIADISAEMLNRFIISFGKKYFNESDFNDLEKAKERYTDLNWIHDELKTENIFIGEIADLLTTMDQKASLLNQNPLPPEVKKLAHYKNYLEWNDLLKVGFVLVSGIPNYDPIANDKLGFLINETAAIKV
jgi:hypothetical protein